MRVKPKVTIVNVVASASLKHGIDLNDIVRAFPDVEYRPETFPGLVFRVKKPKTATLIFSSGRMVCTGARSEKKAIKAIHRVVRELEKAGIIIHGRPEITIQNMVTSIDVGNIVIDIESAIYKLRKNIMHEPEQFPGAIYRMEDPKVVFLIFNTGKLVCVVARREEDVYRAVEKIMALLEEMDVLIGRSF
ncbi:MAG: TATA-box-binding protein [Candidatus Bathyarchaeota archaeon]|nr:TATA-box-binding protein [Candidatus Bathyarchaeota archaeon]